MGDPGIARLADALRAVEIQWRDLRTGLADLWDGAVVEISGWVAPIEATERCDYFLLLARPACCIGCLPSDPAACVEVSSVVALRNSRMLLPTAPPTSESRPAPKMTTTITRMTMSSQGPRLGMSRVSLRMRGPKHIGIGWPSVNLGEHICVFF